MLCGGIHCADTDADVDADADADADAVDLAFVLRGKSFDLTIARSVFERGCLSNDCSPPFDSFNLIDLSSCRIEFMNWSLPPFGLNVAVFVVAFCIADDASKRVCAVPTPENIVSSVAALCYGH